MAWVCSSSVPLLLCCGQILSQPPLGPEAEHGTLHFHCGLTKPSVQGTDGEMSTSELQTPSSAGPSLPRSSVLAHLKY